MGIVKTAGISRLLERIRGCVEPATSPPEVPQTPPNPPTPIRTVEGDLLQFSKRLLRVEGELEELQSLLTVKVKTFQGPKTRLSPLGRHLFEKKRLLNQ